MLAMRSKSKFEHFEVTGIVLVAIDLFLAGIEDES